MLKGMGIGAIIKLVLAIMIASLFISISSVGSIGQALQQSFTDIGQYTDRTVEIDDVETISDLTMFSRDRASNQGCRVAVPKVNSGDQQSKGDPRGDWEEGYPGLRGTYLTDTPSCFGGDAGVTRDSWEILPGRLGTEGDADNYMPGIYSREQFEVTENITIDTNNDRFWIENGLRYVDDRSVPEVADETGEQGTIGNIMDWAERQSIVIGIADDWFGDGAPSTKIGPTTLIYKDGSVNLPDRTNYDNHENIEGGDQIQAQLCEGDEGYVQSNRGKLDNAGLTNDEPVYPIIVIEETNHKTCDGSDSMHNPSDYGANSVPGFIPDDWESISASRKHEFTNSYDNTFWWAMTEHPDDQSGDPSFEFKVMSGDVDLGDGDWRITGKVQGPEDSNYNQMSEGWNECTGSSNECTFQGTMDNADYCGTHKIEVMMDYQPNDYYQWWNPETEFQDESDSVMQETFTTEIEDSCDDLDEDSSLHDPDNYGADSVPVFIPDEWASIPWQRKHEFTNSYDSTFWWAMTEYPEDGTVEVSNPEDANPSFKLEVLSKDQDLGDGDWRMVAGIKGPGDSDYNLMSEGWQDCTGSADECAYQGTIDNVEDFGTYEIEITMDYYPNDYYQWWNSETEFQDEDDAALQETFKIEVENSN